MESNHQKLRSQALGMVKDLACKEQTRGWENGQGSIGEDIKRANFNADLAMAELLAFIDGLIEGHGYSPEIQELINTQNGGYYK